jgi:23S rRNA pseudouridine2605 synthase
MRLQKYLAGCGVASRRTCEEYILQGKVMVNGTVIRELGTKVTEEDVIVYDNQIISLEKTYAYYVLNKPVGYITTVKDEKNRPTVLDIMEEIEERIFPVGRLDYNTSGLIILTNDGALTYALTHPKHQVDKTYHVKVKGRVDNVSIEKLQTGVVIDGRKTAPALVKVLEKREAATKLSITIHEGRNRQIRKMCEAIGHNVIKLTRDSIGEITLEGLPLGKYRELTKKEVAYLKKVGGIDLNI